MNILIQGGLDGLKGQPEKTNGTTGPHAKDATPPPSTLIHIGSIVDVMYENGDEFTFVIANLDDHYKKLPEGIRAMSHKTPTAKALLGHAAGETRTFTVPLEGRDVINAHTIKILKVS